MNHRQALVASAIAAAVCAAAPTPAGADGAAFEKCYGVARAGRNDCQTATSACAGTSPEDGRKDAYLYLPKGLCEKLTGGRLEPTRE